MSWGLKAECVKRPLRTFVTPDTDVQKRISANFKEQVLAKDLKALFDTENVKKAEGKQKWGVPYVTDAAFYERAL